MSEKATDNADVPMTGNRPDDAPRARGAGSHVRYFEAIDPKNLWEDAKQPWAATPQGRLAIRSFSRAVMGAAFYAWGGHKAAQEMATYDPENPHGTLQHIAKFFDVAAGKPLEKIFGKDAISFRHTLKGGPRGLGEEVIESTFNFAMASAGDAIGRQIMGLVDPNAESKWRDEHGKINFSKAVKSTLAASLSVFEAQLEDWVVAVPYAFQKKAQRHIIDRFSPGFKYDADRALNGSSFKLDENGKIVGTYELEGALDLQARFTGYNIGTLMYRDASKSFKRKLRSMVDDYHDDVKIHLPASPKSVITAATDGVHNAFRYTLKSIIKGVLMMTPSVPVFWAVRSPQGKHQALAIDANGMPLMGTNGDYLRANGPEGSTFGMRTADGTDLPNPFADPDFDPYRPTKGVMDHLLNPFGKFSHTVHGTIDNAIVNYGVQNNTDVTEARDLASRYVNGAIAYTPYIYAKSEFAHRWDTQSMDQSIYQTIDGAFRLNWQGMRQGMRNIRKSLRNHGSDMHAGHPETIPADYDRETGQFVDSGTDSHHSQEMTRRHRIRPKEERWQDRVRDDVLPPHLRR